jgi:hypothetical protein
LPDPRHLYLALTQLDGQPQNRFRKTASSSPPDNNRPGEIADCRAADRQATTAAVNTRIRISSLPSHGIGPQCSLERY